MKSILQDKKECFLCRMVLGQQTALRSDGLEEHHAIFGTAGRQKSEEHGLKVWLCPNHHRLLKCSVHQDADVANLVKMYAQEVFETSHSREEWMEIFGRSYL